MSFVRRSWDLVKRPAISARSRDPDFSLTAQRNIDELFRATNGIRLLQGSSVEAVGLAESFNRRLNIPTNNLADPGEASTPGQDDRKGIEREVEGSKGGSNGALPVYSASGTSFDIPLSFETAITGFRLMFRSSGGGSMNGNVILSINGNAITTSSFNTTARDFPSQQYASFAGNVIKGQQQGQPQFYAKGSILTVSWNSFSPAGHFAAFDLSVIEKKIVYI